MDERRIFCLINAHTANPLATIATNPNLTTMTSYQQKIAIAKACEWTDCEYIKSLGLCKGKHRDSRVQYDSGHSDLPDYLNDLNAMHEAEKVLSEKQWVQYDSMMPLRDPQKIHATARQRAEAFLRTLGLWQETNTQPQPIATDCPATPTQPQ